MGSEVRRRKRARPPVASRIGPAASRARVASRVDLHRAVPCDAPPHPAPAVKKSADQWFAEYGESHQDHTNELIHWICVPVIFFCVLGFVWSIPVPAAWEDGAPWFNWVLVAIAVAMIFYVRLSPRLSAGLFLFMVMCHGGIIALDLSAPWLVWEVCAVVFVLAWIGQFIGHKIEGKKPSFFKDLVFLLIGPAWLMSMVYKKLGQKY
jgi:uncharacterized membrane protein YGL010W